MRFIIDTIPKFCPGCGRRIYADQFNIQDFNAGCAFTCWCSVEYQRVNSEDIKILAAQHGDSGTYWK